MSTFRVRGAGTLRGGFSFRGGAAVVPPPPPPAPLTAPVFWVKYHPTGTSFGGGTLPAAMTDITADVMSVEWGRGRSAALDEASAGTATLRLRNESRQWEPGFAAGPYNPIVLGEPFVIGCTWQGQDYTLFYGFSESIDVVWDPTWASAHSEVEIRLTDALALMVRKGNAFTATFQELGSIRIGKELTRMAFPLAMRNITGGGLCIAHTASGLLGQTPAGLEYIQMAVKTHADDRPFWIDRRGYAMYTGTTASGLVFGDDQDAGELKYTASRLHLGKELFITEARVTGLGGTEQVSGGFFAGGQSHSRTTLNVSDSAAATVASYIQSTWGTPRTKLEGFRVMPGGSEDLWNAVLTLDLEHLITVRRRPPGGGTMFTQTPKILGLKWTVQGHPHHTVIDYALAVVPPPPPPH